MAAVFGLDGQLRASSRGYATTSAEVETLLSGFNDPSNLYASGVFLDGQKYMILRCSDRSMYLRKEGDGVTVAKTAHVVLIGHYDQSMQPDDAFKIVEDLADYLRSTGY